VPELAGRPRSGARGRRLAAGTGLALTLAVGSVLPASAAPVDQPAPATRCQLTDPRLPEVSGLVEVGDRMLVHNDGGDSLDVYVLDGTCAVVTVHSAAVDPYDPEDMALAVDGTVWLADTGDNTGTRTTVALLAMHADGSSSVYRLAYPDGPRDVEALLLAPDGTPYLVTKEVLGASEVYRPVSALVEDGTVGLTEVGGVEFVLTGTPGGPVGRAGQLMVTGGAVSPDERWIALRTYTDAYVWPLTGSDVPAALAAAPTRIPLPESPQGEAITFAADNRTLLVASEGLPSDLTSVPLAPETVAALAPPTQTVVPSLSDLTRSGLSPITNGLIAAAVATVVVWIGGKLRRRP
jgi:hypothetical protein